MIKMKQYIQTVIMMAMIYIRICPFHSVTVNIPLLR